jgi:hypothetical protein
VTSFLLEPPIIDAMAKSEDTDRPLSSRVRINSRPAGRPFASTATTAQPHMLRRLSALLRGECLGSGLGLHGLVQPAPVSTPDIVPDGGKFIEATYSNPAGTRAYKLYIPSGYHGQALPLVVMLHGCTQSPDDFAAGTRMNLIAEEQTCLVVYPAQPSEANAAKCWNWFRPSDQRRGQGEPSLIAGAHNNRSLVFVRVRQRSHVTGTLTIRPLPVWLRGSYTMAPAIASPNPVRPIGIAIAKIICDRVRPLAAFGHFLEG